MGTHILTQPEGKCKKQTVYLKFKYYFTLSVRLRPPGPTLVLGVSQKWVKSKGRRREKEERTKVSVNNGQLCLRTPPQVADTIPYHFAVRSKKKLVAIHQTWSKNSTKLVPGEKMVQASATEGWP